MREYIEIVRLQARNSYKKSKTKLKKLIIREKKKQWEDICNELNVDIWVAIVTE